RRCSEGAMRNRGIVRGPRTDCDIPAPFRADCIERDLQRNIRKALEKTGHERGQEQPPVYRIRSDAKRSGRWCVQLRDRCARGIAFLSYTPGVRVQKASG